METTIYDGPVVENRLFKDEPSHYWKLDDRKLGKIMEETGAVKVAEFGSGRDGWLSNEIYLLNGINIFFQEGVPHRLRIDLVYENKDEPLDTVKDLVLGQMRNHEFIPETNEPKLESRI